MNGGYIQQRTRGILFLLILFVLITFDFGFAKYKASSEETYKLNSKTMDYFQKSHRYKKVGNLTKALEMINLGRSLIKNRSILDEEYLIGLIGHAKTLIDFGRLDEAERLLLESTEISHEHINNIVNSLVFISTRDLLKVAKELQTIVTDKPEDVGVHLVLSYLYNMLRNENKMKREQQLVHDIGKVFHLKIMGLRLYEVRGKKETAHYYIMALEKEIDKKGHSRQVEISLGFLYQQAGLFKKARQIANKYIELNDCDTEALGIMRNVEMSEGNYSKVLPLDKRILKLDPNAKHIFQEQYFE